MACAVLAADPSLRGGPDGTTPIYDAETERRRTQLANACRLLEIAGEKSPMALGMVRRLVGVLRKHRIHGVGVNESVQTNFQGRDRPEVSPTSVNLGNASSNFQEHTSRQEVPVDPLRSGPVQQQQPQHQHQQQQMDDHNWAFDPMDTNVLSGIWNDFLCTDPTKSGWEQLFADLDYHNGGI